MQRITISDNEYIELRDDGMIWFCFSDGHIEKFPDMSYIKKYIETRKELERNQIGSANIHRIPTRADVSASGMETLAEWEARMGKEGKITKYPENIGEVIANSDSATTHNAPDMSGIEIKHDAMGNEYYDTPNMKGFITYITPTGIHITMYGGDVLSDNPEMEYPETYVDGQEEFADEIRKASTEPDPKDRVTIVRPRDNNFLAFKSEKALRDTIFPPIPDGLMPEQWEKKI